jgi:hypothetical protein
MPIRILVSLALLAAVCAPLAHGAGASKAPVDPCTVSHANDYGNLMVANATQTGVISVGFFNAEGARVFFFECVDGRGRALGSSRIDPDPATNPPTALVNVTTWSCDRLVRRFASVATMADGTLAYGDAAVRTVSCARRLKIVAPRRVAPGATVRIRVVDQWGIGGIHPRLCITPPQAERACRTLAFGRAVTVATHGFHATTRGLWRIELKVRRHRVRAAVAVGAGLRVRVVTPPTVLATGDSTMQGIDSFLSDELGDAATVRSDIQPGSGISRTDYWTRHAASQTRKLKQRVTVISVGAATDSMPLAAADGTTVQCCDEPWVLAYSDRVRTMMKTYLRGGHGSVFWLTPPLPRPDYRARIVAAVSDAATRAAAGLRGVVVSRVDQFFSPHGYRPVMRYRGRDVLVRATDGIHLSVAGTAIVADLLAPAIKHLLARQRRVAAAG